jgi:hypothetical protein
MADTRSIVADATKSGVETAQEWAEFLMEYALYAFGSGTPEQQMASSLVLAIGFYLATPIGWYLTLTLGALFTFTLFIGALRYGYQAYAIR